ncbi:MAG: hypothetical protein QG621_496 [Patescibacteria group bacterium]|nr:hypothetical protein [Patescibacteria group bacterium]
MTVTHTVEKLQPQGVEWTLNVMKTQEEFPGAALSEANTFIQHWSDVFPKGNTWVGRQYGVPSLAIRLDCVVDTNGKLQIFEVEDRPCGLGIAGQINPHFKEKLDALRREWPSFGWVKAPGRLTDDVLWLGEGVDLRDATASEGLLLVRSRPEDREFHVLEPRAISTVQNEGYKGCCTEGPIQLFSRISWVEDPEEQRGGYVKGLPQGPIVVKPIRGTRAREVKVFLNGHDPKDFPIRRTDKVSLGDMERWLRQRKVAIYQPLIRPMRLDYLPCKNVIYRLFFGFSPSAGKYLPLGGVWMASDSLIVHGTDEAISGPLVC